MKIIQIVSDRYDMFGLGDNGKVYRLNQFAKDDKGNYIPTFWQEIVVDLPNEVKE